MPSEKKIFIVDDNEMLSMALEDYLTRRIGHEVATFTTGEECLEQIADMPDVVVLDYNLDSEDKNAKNGAQILADIKAFNAAIKVVMLSSKDAHGTSLQTLAGDADFHVFKSEEAFEEIATIVNSLP